MAFSSEPRQHDTHPRFPRLHCDAGDDVRFRRSLVGRFCEELWVSDRGVVRSLGAPLDASECGGCAAKKMLNSRLSRHCVQDFFSLQRKSSRQTINILTDHQSQTVRSQARPNVHPTCVSRPPSLPPLSLLRPAARLGLRTPTASGLQTTSSTPSGAVSGPPPNSKNVYDIVTHMLVFCVT